MFLINLEDSFLDIWELVRKYMGKLAGILFLKFFMDFVENGLILLVGIFLGIRGGPEISDKKFGRKNFLKKVLLLF